jgi:hypothetical protein
MWSIRLSRAPAIIEDHGLLNPGDGLSDPRTPPVTSAKPPWCTAWRFRGYEANAQSQPTLLNLRKASPNVVFTTVLYGDNRAKFGTPETSLRGRRICVTGKISDYQGKPEIVLTEPSQLGQ